MSRQGGPCANRSQRRGRGGEGERRRSTKGRGGKIVTTVIGVPGGEAAQKTLAAELKRSCGTGGSLKDGVIEIQGEHRDTLVRELESRGFKVKRAG